MSNQLPVIVAGGGIGGVAVTQVSSSIGKRQHLLRGRVDPRVVLEPRGQTEGAGIQLGPNAFHAFDALGIGDKARSRSVFTDEMVMHDAIDGKRIGRIPTGEAFRKRFNNPYAVIHRVDVHTSLLEGATETGQVGFNIARYLAMENRLGKQGEALGYRQIGRPGADRTGLRQHHGL